MRQRFPSMQTSSEDPHDVAGKTKLKGARSNWFYAASGKTSGGTCSHTHTQWAPSGWRRRGSSSERSRSRRCLPRLVAGLPAKWPSPRTANTFSLSLLWWGLPVASDLLLWLLQRKFPRSFFPRIAAKLHPPPPPLRSFRSSRLHASGPSGFSRTRVLWLSPEWSSCAEMSNFPTAKLQESTDESTNCMLRVNNNCGGSAFPNFFAGQHAPILLQSNRSQGRAFEVMPPYFGEPNLTTPVGGQDEGSQVGPLSAN